MSQFIFIEDFIIAKSEIVSVQFHFEKRTDSRLNRTERLATTPRAWGKSTVVFVLKDGSTRIIEERGYSERLTELKEKVISQMQEVMNSAKPAKTTTTTTIRKIPVNPW